MQGKIEAAEFIRKRKYIEGKDEQGDIVDRKVQKHELERVGEIQKSSEVTAEQAKKVEDAMDAWWPGQGAGQSSSTTAVLDGKGVGKGYTENGKGSKGKVKGKFGRRGMSALLDGGEEEGEGNGEQNKDKKPKGGKCVKGKEGEGKGGQSKTPQKELEAHRLVMLRIVSATKVVVKDIKNACAKGSALVKAGVELLNYAKPHMK